MGRWELHFWILTRGQCGGQAVPVPQLSSAESHSAQSPSPRLSSAAVGTASLLQSLGGGQGPLPPFCLQGRLPPSLPVSQDPPTPV